MWVPSGDQAGARSWRLFGESTVTISASLHDFFISATSSSGKLALEITRWLLYYVKHQLGRPLTTAAALERAIAAALADMKSKQ